MNLRCLIATVAALGGLTGSSAADDLSELAVKRSVEAAEKVKMPDHFIQPVYLSQSTSTGTVLQLMSAAIGTDGGHGIRNSWLYEVKDQNLKRVFKLPFDATELTGESPPNAKGFFWVYDCYVCDGPEAGYMFKIPVITVSKKGRYGLTVDAVEPVRGRLKTESLAILKKAQEKYGSSRKEPGRLRRQLDELFEKGLSSQ